MKNVTLIVLALLGLAAAAPAQIHFDGILGRRVQVSGSVGAVSRPAVRAVTRHGDFRRPVHSGHWQTVTEQVHVPGYYKNEFVPPRYGWYTNACGHQVYGLIEPGHMHRCWVPARCETRTRRIWVTGC